MSVRIITDIIALIKAVVRGVVTFLSMISVCIERVFNGVASHDPLQYFFDLSLSITQCKQSFQQVLVTKANRMLKRFGPGRPLTSLITFNIDQWVRLVNKSVAFWVY